MAFSGRSIDRSVANLGFDIALIGLALFGCILVFHIVTFPVELDASRRAMGLLRQSGVLTHDDIGGARSVLTAAALTYFAAIAASAIQVLYWAMQVFSRRD
jgi:Zn-dependent membrane protease YugP